VVGIVLVIALLTIPAAIARQFECPSLRKIMAVSVVLGMLFTVAGLFLSYLLNLASGATIVIFAALFYIFTALGKLVRKKAWQGFFLKSSKIS
jgi:zinc transport system permease protein